MDIAAPLRECDRVLVEPHETHQDYWRLTLHVILLKSFPAAWAGVGARTVLILCPLLTAMPLEQLSQSVIALFDIQIKCHANSQVVMCAFASRARAALPK